MLVITTWKIFLLYILDYVTKDELTAASFFVANNQIRLDTSAYQVGEQVVRCNTLWPVGSDLDECLQNPDRFWKYLEDISSSPKMSFGAMMTMNLCVPSFLFIPDMRDHKQSTRLVKVFQKFIYETFGMSSIWFDGLLFDQDGNEYPQDREKLKQQLTIHLKRSDKNIKAARAPVGPLYRDTRMYHLQAMKESEQRKYLKDKFKVDTVGMDASTVFQMMVDLFVDENDGVDHEELKDAVRRQYKEKKKHK